MPFDSLMRRSILCVEGDASDRERLRSGLDGFDLTVACTAAEALRALNSGAFDGTCSSPPTASA